MRNNSKVCPTGDWTQGLLQWTKALYRGTGITPHLQAFLVSRVNCLLSWDKNHVITLSSIRRDTASNQKNEEAENNWTCVVKVNTMEEPEVHFSRLSETASVQVGVWWVSSTRLFDFFYCFKGCTLQVCRNKLCQRPNEDTHMVPVVLYDALLDVDTVIHFYFGSVQFSVKRKFAVSVRRIFR